MKLSDILRDIEDSMQHRSDYEGITPDYALSTALTAHNLITPNVSIPNAKPLKKRFGVLERHMMISGIIYPGFDDTMIMLAPIPTQVDEAAALLTRDGIVIAAYTNHLDGYESFAFWDDIRIPRPTSRYDIPLDLFVGPLDLTIGHAATGIEIAVRYLFETRTKLPLGLESESI